MDCMLKEEEVASIKNVFLNFKGMDIWKSQLPRKMHVCQIMLLFYWEQFTFDSDL